MKQEILQVNYAHIYSWNQPVLSKCLKMSKKNKKHYSLIM